MIGTPGLIKLTARLAFAGPRSRGVVHPLAIVKARELFDGLV